MSQIKAFNGEMMSDHPRPTRLNMLIAAVALVSPATSQPPPASSTSPQVTPAQPGSLTKLYDIFGSEQKKVADGIVIGLMGMPMGMM